MEATTDWYAGIEKEISSLKDEMSKGDYKLYELDLLLRVAKRVADFSSDCELCQDHRNDVSKLVADLKNLPEITKEEVAGYGRTLRTVIKHIQKYHLLNRSGLNPVLPLGIAVLLSVISYGLIAISDGSMGDIRGWIGLLGLFFAAISLIWGVYVGIKRLLAKRI
jgi:hypothetical protein